MKKFWIQVFLLVSGTFLVLYFSFNKQFEDFSLLSTSSQSFDYSTLKVGEVMLNIEIADTPNKRSKGLSGRPSLPLDSGMLFIFPEEKKYQFWMKGVEFPLDFIFIKDGKVVDIINNATPPSGNQKDAALTIYSPSMPIDSMLEVNGGVVSSSGIKVGDLVTLRK
ncbi:MAG: DUF192 domain-containing protein [Candidatus Daviesbacteria bacterium]|nr:DUF192 domain-containing protein [Candidatus Daviesbacteria bacterium]